MSFPKAQKFEHVELAVKDLAATAEFYREVIGMVEIAEEAGTVYLGFGLDENYDIALREGEPALGHFAIRMDTADDVEKFERRLAEANVPTERRDGQEPGQDVALRFRLPGGHVMELVSVHDKRYLNPAQPALTRNRGIRPLDTCHINLMGPQVKATADFLCDVVGFKLSEVVEPVPDSGQWVLGFTRLGRWHHDVAMTIGGQSLNHFAVAMESMDHIKQACDMLAANGARIEVGPLRHPVGANLAIYVLMPGGHRMELSAEMAQLEEDTPARFWRGIEDSLDAWSDVHTRLPETFMQGSG